MGNQVLHNETQLIAHHNSILLLDTRTISCQISVGTLHPNSWKRKTVKRRETKQKCKSNDFRLHGHRACMEGRDCGNILLQCILYFLVSFSLPFSPNKVNMYIRSRRNTKAHQHLKSPASVSGPMPASPMQHRFISMSATRQISNNVTYISQQATVQRNASPIIQHLIVIWLIG